LAHVTAESIRQSAFKLYPNAKPATRNRQVIAATQAVYDHAARLIGMAEIKVSRFPVETTIKTATTAEWVHRFADCAGASDLPHLGALCMFMFGTGARIGEATTLTWADIDFSKQTAIIRQTKVADTCEAHLPNELLVALANIPSNRKPDDLVFGYGDRHSVKHTWDRVIEWAGIERVKPHCCRHGFATTLLRAGRDIKTVARLGGWKDAATVLKHYAHAIEDRTLTEAIFDTEPTRSSRSDPISIGIRRGKSI
jgi:integrase